MCVDKKFVLEAEEKRKREGRGGGEGRANDIGCDIKFQKGMNRVEKGKKRARRFSSFFFFSLSLFFFPLKIRFTIGIFLSLSFFLSRSVKERRQVKEDGVLMGRRASCDVTIYLR